MRRLRSGVTAIHAAHVRHKETGMTPPGAVNPQPLRVAIVGSGPAGFYVAEHLLSREDLEVEIDMFERLPTPFGLVRFGVAPDHQKIKSVTRVFDKVAAKPNFRFYGNVDFGAHVTLEDLSRHYHQICFATGAQTDRRMGIPGEDLERSHTATEFVAWFNGHPDYRNRQFDLSVERVAIVGVGNVAVDVARILCRTPDELAATDIADYALEALRESRVREVYMLGRRGPAQAAFTNPEVRELGAMPGADIAVNPPEVALDPLSRARLEVSGDRSIAKKLEILQAFANNPTSNKSRRLTIRFLVSPVELAGDDRGRVAAMRLVKNALYESDDGSLRPKATDQFEELPVDMVFRSVGYRGVALPGLPFDERGGIIPNVDGRVQQQDDEGCLTGVYVSGWIKRGPTGVIGTNKSDAGQTVDRMIDDLRQGATLNPAHPDSTAIDKLVRERQPDFVSYDAWTRLDELEAARGKEQNRPRVKFTSVEEMLAALSV
jgi:ferredoxin--NADP+ reductase